VQVKELLSKLLHPTDDELIGFGKVAPIGFGLIGLVFSGFFFDWTIERPVVLIVFLAIGALCFVGSLIGQTLLISPFYRVLMVIAVVVAPIVTYVLLGLVWLLMFTPVALWFRLTGRDAMHRRIDPAASTYWVTRKGPRDPRSYIRLY
jgi:preprotein translocase subunit Sss1